MSNLGNFVWSIADQLRGVYKPHQYGNVILPFTILRRLDCLMTPHQAVIQRLIAEHDNEVRLGVEVKKATGLGFYNASPYNFSNLLAEPDNLRTNLLNYLDGFSAQVDVFERFKFGNEVATLDEKGRLYMVVSKFADVNLHPDVVPNAEMGDLFEELIRKFAEASNEEAGEHYTPRDAIRLMVDLLFAEEDDALLEPGAVRTIYDPTAGTGGMLSIAENHLLAQNPGARLVMYGQEINDQSYAICKSDMIAKGQDPSNIRLGDTLAEDLFPDRKFDFCMSNPPYGVDWSASQDAVKAERAATGENGRFGAGLPPVADGQMLFLTHLAYKLRPAHQGGGRAGIVMSGSPFFSGGAETGPSEIRRWLLKNDLIDVIVALPTNMFFNTGIPTYIWIIDNSKPSQRRNKVQLIDASSFWVKMSKNLGDKTREIDAAGREAILKQYDAFEDADPKFSKVLPTAAFGYWTVTVERPLIAEDGAVIRDRAGKPKPDGQRRDRENIPFTYADNTEGESARHRVVETYFKEQVLPFVADAWIDESRTKVGYEVPFARLFRQDPDEYVMSDVLDRFRHDEAEATRLAAEVADFSAAFRDRARDEDWPIVPLRRIGRIVNGGTPPPDPDNWDGTIYWATPVDINGSDGFLEATNRTITRAGLTATRLISAGNVLVSSRAPIGSVAVVNVDTAFNQGCKGIVLDPSRMLNHCLAFQLMASKGIMESLGQGTTFLEINGDKLATVPVVIPPLDVQLALPFAEVIGAFHRARRLFESLTDQARVRRRGMDFLIARGAASEIGK